METIQKRIIKKHFEEKGFKNAEVNIKQTDDLTHENEVIVDIYVDKKEKVKVHKIYIDGNEVLSDRKIKWAMKKTNEKGNLLHLFRTKKFVEENYKNDKNLSPSTGSMWSSNAAAHPASPHTTMLTVMKSFILPIPVLCDSSFIFVHTHFIEITSFRP